MAEERKKVQFTRRAGIPDSLSKIGQKQSETQQKIYQEQKKEPGSIPRNTYQQKQNSQHQQRTSYNHDTDDIIPRKRTFETRDSTINQEGHQAPRSEDRQDSRGRQTNHRDGQPPVSSSVFGQQQQIQGPNQSLLKPNQHMLDFEPQFVQRVRLQDKSLLVYLIDSQEIRVLKDIVSEETGKKAAQQMLINKFSLTNSHDVPLIFTSTVVSGEYLFIAANVGLLFIDCTKNETIENLIMNDFQLIQSLNVSRFQDKVYISYQIGDIGFDKDSDQPDFTQTQILVYSFDGVSLEQMHGLKFDDTYIQGSIYIAEYNELLMICQQKITIPVYQQPTNIYTQPYNVNQYQQQCQCINYYKTYLQRLKQVEINGNKVMMVEDQLELPHQYGLFCFVQNETCVTFYLPNQLYFYQVEKNHKIGADDIKIGSIDQTIRQMSTLDNDILVQTEDEIYRITASNGIILNKQLVQKRLHIAQFKFQLSVVGFNQYLFACVYKRKGYDNYIEEMQEQLFDLEKQMQDSPAIAPFLQQNLDKLAIKLQEAQNVGHIILVCAKTPKTEVGLCKQIVL